MKVTVVLAVKSDKKSLMRFYKQQNYSAGLLGLDNVYIIKHQQEIIAAVIISALEKGNSQLFLHGLVTKQEYRHKQLATKLLQHIQIEHYSQQIICFAQQHLANLYQQNGFEQVTAHQLHQPLLMRYLSYKKTNKDLLVFSQNN